MQLKYVIVKKQNITSFRLIQMNSSVGIEEGYESSGRFVFLRLTFFLSTSFIMGN